MICTMETRARSNMMKLCQNILGFDGVGFAGVIDKMGNVVSEVWRKGMQPFEDDAKRRMLYMQMVLEVSMRKEFDESLGPIDYIVSHRKKGLMISVPFDEYVMIISSSREADIQKITAKISDGLKDAVGGSR